MYRRKKGGRYNKTVVEVDNIKKEIKDLMQEMDIEYMPSSRQMISRQGNCFLRNKIFRNGGFVHFANLMGIKTCKEFNAVNLIGEKFGSLIVKGKADRLNGKVRWYCVCSCGEATITATSNLRNGHTKACGSCRNKTHGSSGDRLYSIYMNMKARCGNPNNTHYKYYGGKGIKVSEDFSTYEKFKQWALSNGYDDNLTIDRIDGDDSYSCNNCRWITRKEQSNNIKSNVVLVIRGENLTLSQISTKYNLSSSCVRARYRNGLVGEDLIYQGRYGYGDLQKKRKI